MRCSERMLGIVGRFTQNKTGIVRGAVKLLTIGVVICQMGCVIQKGRGQGVFLLTLRVKSDQPVTAVMDAMRKRAAVLGAFKDDVIQIDSKTVSVRLPGYHDDIKKAERIMASQAMLEFKVVDKNADVAAAEEGDIPPGDELLYQMFRNPKTGKVKRIGWVVKKQILMTGDVLSGVGVKPDANKKGGILVEMDFNSAGAREFERITGEHVREPLAIILDNRVFSAPMIKDRISGGVAIIEGMFSPEEAHELALLLMSPYCCPVEVVKSEWLTPPTANK